MRHFRVPKIFYLAGLLISVTVSWADSGPVFSVTELFEAAPIVVRATVLDIQPRAQAVQHQQRSYGGSQANLQVDRYYKGSGAPTISVKYPSGEQKNWFGCQRTPNYGAGWRKLKKGEALIVFLCPEKDYYRFWYDVNDTYLAVSPAAGSQAADGLTAMKEDIILTSGEKGPLGVDSIRQSRTWPEALERLRGITWDHGVKNYTEALIGRLLLKDPTALDESLTIFDKQYTCGKPGGVVTSDCQDLFNGQVALLYKYVELDLDKGKTLIKSIYDGERPWIHDGNVYVTAKQRLQRIRGERKD